MIFSHNGYQVIIPIWNITAIQEPVLNVDKRLFSKKKVWYNMYLYTTDGKMHALVYTNRTEAYKHYKTVKEFMTYKQGTHYCKQCGAQWSQNTDSTWTLVSRMCDACCDQALMGRQIIKL